MKKIVALVGMIGCAGVGLADIVTSEASQRWNIWDLQTPRLTVDELIDQAARSAIKEASKRCAPMYPHTSLGGPSARLETQQRIFDTVTEEKVGVGLTYACFDEPSFQNNMRPSTVESDVVINHTDHAATKLLSEAFSSFATDQVFMAGDVSCMQQSLARDSKAHICYFRILQPGPSAWKRITSTDIHPGPAASLFKALDRTGSEAIRGEGEVLRKADRITCMPSFSAEVLDKFIQCSLHRIDP